MENISFFIRNNVEKILEHYEGKITNDHQLLLIYWQQVDQIEMDKESISTSDWLKNSTDAMDIINARLMNQAINSKRYY